MYSILYIDDEPVLCDLAIQFLTRSGDMQVISADSAQTGLCLLAEKKFDAVISDFEMPEMDGISLLKTLRSTGNTIPFILFTGRGREDVARDALNNGADFYLQKGGGSCQYTELIHVTRSAIEKRMAAEEMHRSRKQMEAIFSHLPDPTLVIDTEGRVIAWNEAMEKLTGIPASSMIGMNNYAYSIPFYGYRRKMIIDYLISPSDDIQYVYKKPRHEGTVITASTTCRIHEKEYTFWIKASTIYDDTGKMTGAIETLRDTTQRTRLLHVLRNAKNHFETIIDNLPDPTFAIDTRRKIIAWNRAMEVFSGAGKEMVMGKDAHFCAEALYGKKRPILVDYLLDRTPVDLSCYNLVEWGTGTVSAQMQIHPGKADRATTCWATASVLRSESGIFGAIESIRDISNVYHPFEVFNECTIHEGSTTSDSRPDDPNSVQMEKFRLLHEISRHDIRNHLTVVMGMLSLIEPEQGGEQYHEYIKNARKATERICRELSFCAKYQDLGTCNPCWIHVHDCLESVSGTLHDASVSCICQVPENLEVFADPLFMKVCSNLVENAVRHGKKVTEISFFAYFSKQHLVISIRDDGVGISQDEKGLIFTRGYGKNTGLGLYLSREILSITGITIRETGEEGKGAVFELVIPPQGYRIMRMKTDTSSESKTATDVQHGIES